MRQVMANAMNEWKWWVKLAWTQFIPDSGPPSQNPLRLYIFQAIQLNYIDIPVSVLSIIFRFYDNIWSSNIIQSKWFHATFLLSRKRWKYFEHYLYLFCQLCVGLYRSWNHSYHIKNLLNIFLPALPPSSLWSVFQQMKWILCQSLWVFKLFA